MKTCRLVSRGVGEVFPLETEGSHPPPLADLHWLSLSDSLRGAKNNAQMVVVITCVEIIIYRHAPIPPSPPPLKGGFYSAEQFKRKWLQFPGLVCTSVTRRHIGNTSNSSRRQFSYTIYVGVL